MTLAFTGTIDGDKMSGTFRPQGGGGGRGEHAGGEEDHSWTAVRQQGSGRQSHDESNPDEDDEYLTLRSSALGWALLNLAC
jgi:hypothetical protein